MSNFSERLRELKASLLEMSREIVSLVDETAGMIGLPGAEERAQAAIEADSRIDAAEVEIEEKAVELIAMHQPKAGDLRKLVAILKVNNDLERIGDHAANIARSAAHLARLDRDVPIPPELGEMTAIARGMLSDAVEAFTQESTEAAAAVRERDDRVDQLQDSLFRVMLTHMPEHNVSGCLQVILIGRNVERIADLATNIGEDVVYMVQGTTVRHAGRRRVFDR